MPAKVAFLLAVLTVTLQAQRGTGEVRLTAFDAAGLPLIARVELSSDATQTRRSLTTNADGSVISKSLPLGQYTLIVSRPLFKTHTQLLEVRTEQPIALVLTLTVASTGTAVLVADYETLLDSGRPGNAYYLGEQSIQQRRASVPSRAVLELVETQPGWLLEANGVLHPRGAEYNTQYVVDGMPLLDNRSPGFAPPLEVEDIQQMNVLTAGYPAEYGRKLGGVVEVVTARQTDPGFQGRTALGGGSFGTLSGYFSGQFVEGKNTATISSQASQTDRYLDPPSEENFTNHGALAGISGRFERDHTDADRFRFSFQQKRAHFLVPNEPAQEVAGQRQDRDVEEFMGQFAYQRVLSPDTLLHARFMARDLNARLWSNPLSTPIYATQNRGFREFYSNASLSRHFRAHEWKAGAEWIAASVDESFSYRIVDADEFDDEVAPQFSFADRRQSREASFYIQDSIRWLNVTISAGLRADHYRFLLQDTAWSPRLGAAWHFPAQGLVLRASYDRAFEVPAVENLLLASSTSAARLSDEGLGLPVPTSRGNYYQAGFSKTVGGVARLDAYWYRRTISNYADDEVLLNTGVSFPITFAQARIEGAEVKLELRPWRGISGFVSFANLSGTGELPVTGGLFLDDADDLLSERTRFRITQDQRNTVQGRLRWQLKERFWVAGGARYGSGLPVELEDEIDISRYSPDILERVNFERGRVRPSFFLDAAAGADLWRREGKMLSVQIDGTNLTDRLNLINFAGLFSGTALAAPRAVMVRLTSTF